MTKLLSAKELLEVVRTAQADVQATGGGAKWPPRMAVGGRSAPRRRAEERARERDAQAVPAARPRGGTIPVMAAVELPTAQVAPVAPLPVPPPPGYPATSNRPLAPTADSDPLPPASAILAAMRAKGGLPIPREPEPMTASTERIQAPPRPPSLSSIEALVEPRRRAPTHPEPASIRPPPVPDPMVEDAPPAAARSMAALFPPPRRPSGSVPESAPEPPTPRAPAPTMPEVPMALKSSPPSERTASGERIALRRSSPPLSPPLAREELDEPRPNAAQRREKTSPAASFSALGRLTATRVPAPVRDDSPSAAPPPSAPARAASAPPAAPAPAAPRAGVDVSWATTKPSWAPASAALDAPDDLQEEGPVPVALSKDETIVLLNYDAQSSLEALSERTGFSVFKVERIVERLMVQGVFEDLPASPEAPKAKVKPVARDQDAPMLMLEESSPDSEAPPTEVDPRRPGEEGDPELEELEEELEEELVDDEAAAEDAPEDELERDDDPETALEREEARKSDADEAALEANYRKLYETKLARLDSDQRMSMATLATGPELFALAFDKDPQVSRALFDNERFSVEHARFAAFCHPTSFGIDRLATRNELLKDPQVQRKLLRNPHTPELVVRRVLSPRRLLEIYKLTGDRDVPDRQRMVARTTLRQKFTTSEPEERMQLLWNTEGRCLTLLSGCAIDSKTTALFCARPVVSLMMVQNFAKYGATPPSLLAHFLKQNLVKRQVPLRNLLLRHPNCPSEAKRGAY